MEQRSVLLRGIASVLNAGGSALLNLYDAVTSIKTIVGPGEKRTLSFQLREYGKKIERLYCEIGKEVVLRTNTAEVEAEGTAPLSAAAEAGIKQVAEYQAEIEKIRQRIRQIEAEEQAAATVRKEAVPEHVAAKVKAAAEPTAHPIADAEEPAVTEPPVPEMVAESAGPPETAAESTDDTPEESAEILVEAVETPEPETPEETPESETPISGETLVSAETETEAAAVKLETLSRSDLLKMCRKKGIEADKRTPKAKIIALLSEL